MITYASVSYLILHVGLHVSIDVVGLNFFHMEPKSESIINRSHNCLIQMCIHLNKIEALSVLSEIRDALKKSGGMSCVSLDGSQVSHVLTGGYEIRIKCELDTVSRDIINGVLKRYELLMKEQNGYVILRSLKD